MFTATQKLAAFRSALAERQPRDRLGRFAHKGAMAAVSALENPATRRDLLVNTGGFLASAIAGAVAGPEAALAADLGGALAVRAVLVGRDLLYSAKLRASHRSSFKKATSLQQSGLVGKQILSDLKKTHIKERLSDDLTADVAGWAIGNTAANVIAEMLPTIAKVPLKGAAVAAPLVPRILALKKEIARRRKNYDPSR